MPNSLSDSAVHARKQFLHSFQGDGSLHIMHKKACWKQKR